MSLRARLLAGMAVVAVVLVGGGGRHRPHRPRRDLVDQVDEQLGVRRSAASVPATVGGFATGGTPVPTPSTALRSQRRQP